MLGVCDTYGMSDYTVYVSYMAVPPVGFLLLAQIQHKFHAQKQLNSSKSNVEFQFIECTFFFLMYFIYLVYKM